MNWRRVILGGLLAGVVSNMVGLTGAALFGLAAEFQRLGLEASVGAGLQHLTIRFVIGLVTVFFYAAVRPRFGPGPRTALIVALALWVGSYVPFVLVLHEFGAFAGPTLWGVLAWGLLEASLVSVVGGWAYREAHATAA